MTLKPDNRYKLSLVLQYAVLFQFLTIFFYVVYFLTDRRPQATVSLGAVDFRLLLAVFPGALVGFVDEFVLRPKFKRKRFIYALIFRTFILTLIIAVALLILGLLIGYRSWQGFFKTSLFYAGQTLLAISIFQIRRFVGRGRIIPFITGKYSHPTWENNLIMFVDLKASTTLADSLDSKIYSEFIRDFISDISEPIYLYQGRIYQYVGDEVVVYWKRNTNKRKNTRPIRCFVGMMNIIEKRKAYYMERYGILPEFKAGLHGGPLIVAEVGELKKEIAFHGRVMNTTARIQKKCNSLNTNFLVSDYIISQTELAPDFVPFTEGKFLLKGKVEKVELFSIEKAENARKRE